MDTDLRVVKKHAGLFFLQIALITFVQINLMCRQNRSFPGLPGKHGGKVFYIFLELPAPVKGVV